MRSRLHSAAQRRNIWPPEPGTFCVRLAKSAWRVPAQIIHSDIGWQAEVDGVKHPPHLDPALALHVAMVWHHGTMIPRDSFQWLNDVRAWAKVNCPDHPALFPLRAIDPNKIPPIPPSARAPAEQTGGHQHG
jgi:hypothetical protein